MSALTFRSFDQIWLCFKQKSGDGLSLGFLIIVCSASRWLFVRVVTLGDSVKQWLLGDTTNMLGALWQGLATPMVILALYYTFCDCVLIFQVYWYRWRRRRNPSAFPPLPSEQDPLLSAFSSRDPDDDGAIGSAKNNSSAAWSSRWRDIAAYVVPCILIVVFGIGSWITGKDIKRGQSHETWDTDAQIVGWISAFLYRKSLFQRSRAKADRWTQWAQGYPRYTRIRKRSVTACPCSWSVHPYIAPCLTC